jgi:lipopolysaccharide export system protein LptA
LTVFYEAGRGAAAAGQASRETQTNPLGGEGAIRKINCKGPVTIVSKTQVATGDNAEFDRTRNRVLLVGNAALSDGPNVTRGERVAYDLNTGIANVEGGGQGGRVRALIVPGSQNNPGQAPPKR